MENLSGASIKGYELRERIGTGGFGAVYRAYQSSVGREVAIKIILPPFANHPDFIRRFEAEAGLVARLEHPHIIPLHDYWRDSTGAYLVMRWLRSGSLSEALKDGPYELRAAALLLDQVTSALSLAHRNNVIHRDIKPANILLDEDSNAYVADFGIAKELSGINTNTTQTDVVIGSPDYLSPEQARSEPISPQTDIYSLGVMVYELLTGQHPFPNVTPIERMFKHLNEPIPQVISLASEITSGVNAVIQYATAKNPAHRYGDVLEMAVAFQEAAGLRRLQNGDNMVEVLTQREQEVLQRIIKGQSNKQIAQELVITLATVKWYINEIYGKLHVRSRVQAIVRARELSLISNEYNDLSTGSALVLAVQVAPENPYKGLRAFQPADTQDFFGREALTDKLVKRLNELGDMSRFLAVIGPSGSGKSSLVKAGLIPTLWRGALPGSERWFVVEMRPGSHPLDELETALTRIASQQPGNLREQLQRDERGLLRVAQLVLPNDGSHLVLVIDQFEEVFTLVEDEKVRVHFLNLIHKAVADPRSRVQVIVTLRADFYDRPLLYPEFGELVRSRMEMVLPLTAEGLEQAISCPAERVGVTFESGLVATIISEVNYQPGALPLLQYALTELFDHRQERVLTHQAYEEIGGMVGALARRADEIYEELDAENQEGTRQMFMRLVTLGEGVEDTQRRVPRSELMALAADADTMDDLIDTYAAYRILSVDHDPLTRSPTVEVAHEAILREWQRLRGWLNDSRHDIRLQRLLEIAAAEWYQAKRDDSFLLRGSRLEQFQTWANGTKSALTPRERDYLDAGLAEREQQTLAEQKRQVYEAKLERRSRNFLWGLVAVLLVAMFGAVGLTVLAQQNAARADHNAAEAQNVALIAGSQAALANGNTDQAIALALQAVTLNPNSARAQVALSEAAYMPGTIRTFVGHSGSVRSVAVSQDGRTAISASDDKAVILWDIQTGKMLRRFEGHTDLARSVAFMPDGLTAISGSVDKTLIQWDIQTGKIIRRFEGQPDSIWSLGISPDGLYVASGGSTGTIILWDIETGKMVRSFEGHSGGIHSSRFSADSTKLVSTSDDKTLILWDVGRGQFLHHFKGLNAAVLNAVFSPDNSMILSGSDDGTMNLWDIKTGQSIRRFYAGDPSINDVAFSPDGRVLISGGVKGIALWNIETAQPISRLRGHGGIVNSIALSRDGRTALSASADHTLRLWDLEQGQLIHRYTFQGLGWTAFTATGDGHMVIAAWDAAPRTTVTSSDRTPHTIVTTWDVATGKENRRFSIKESIIAIAFSPDGQTALFGTNNEYKPSDVILWDVVTGKEIRRFTGHPGGITSVAFSPDGRAATSAGAYGVLVLWDVATGKEIRRSQGYESTTWWSYVGFSPDGQTFVACDYIGRMVLWDFATGKEIRHFEGNSPDTRNFVFSDNGQRAFSGSTDGTTILWDVASGSILHRFSDHSGPIALVDMTFDGQFGIAGSADDTTTVWDLNTRGLIRRYHAGIYSAFFSPDNRTVLVGAGQIELWRVDGTLDELLTWIHASRYIPELTCDQRELYRLESLCAVDVTLLPTKAG